jgi:hypothetical protein
VNAARCSPEYGALRVMSSERGGGSTSARTLLAVLAAGAMVVSALVTPPVVRAVASAHEGQPIQVQIQEQEPGAFLVQWRVPKTLPIEAMPALVLPESCRSEGERTVIELPAAWMNRQLYRCSEPLSGQVIQVSYPLYNPAMTTLVRVDFLGGERFAHVLNPTEDSWRVPEAGADGIAWLRGARRAVLDGISHLLGHWVHLLFLAAICLLGRSLSIRLATAFAAGQLAAVALAAGLGLSPDPRVAEICVAIAVAFLAAQALRPPEARRQLPALAAGAGLFHGFGVAAAFSAAGGVAAPDWLYLLSIVLGMDAALLILALGVNALGALWARRWPSGSNRRALAYGLGGTAVAVALTLGLGRGSAREAEARFSPRLPGATGGLGGTSMPGSRRLAPQAPDAPIQSFLAVEPYEVRHEILVRLADVVDRLRLEGDGFVGEGFVEIEAQEEVGRRIADLVVERTAVVVDGEPVEAIVDRFAFMTVGPRGVLPRASPEPEAVGEAMVGVTVAYPAPGMPDVAAFDGPEEIIPTTVTDPESSLSAELTAGAPTVRWENALAEDPIPTVAGIEVEPPQLPLPLASLALLLVALALGAAALRGRRATTSFALSRVTLALAVIAVPVADVTLKLPPFIRSVPTESQARRILAGVLPNVYRAFELRDETAAYDRLAVSVTGPTLTEVYLEHRRALEMEERGGARARVEAVEVLEVRDVEPAADGGFTAEAGWKVGGTVTHFGHRHFRQNGYDARVELLPDDGTWKVRSIEILEEERLR